MKISVFGGTRPEPGSGAYQQAYQLGQLLGSAGMTVLTGGYQGTMEAVSRGASEAGAHVIGVTSEAIEAYRPIQPNAWVDEEWRFEGFKERLNTLVEDCDAAFALPGGIGTLLEVCLTWNQLVINSIPAKPLILIGDEWRKVLDIFFLAFDDYVPPKNRQFISFAPDPQRGVDILIKFQDHHFKNNQDSQ
ncbi:MAG: LOG family protein [Chloroflexota bacterium]|nr:LOG family protein [Chloroflexota bacterium]